MNYYFQHRKFGRDSFSDIVPEPIKIGLARDLASYRLTGEPKGYDYTMANGFNAIIQFEPSSELIFTPFVQKRNVSQTGDALGTLVVSVAGAFVAHRIGKSLGLW
ncbi:hypothetical protein L0244_38335 [bacterium]|nr:hypothetical protein [bacterium]